MDKEQEFKKLISAIECKFPPTKGGQFIGELSDDYKVDMMVNTKDNGMCFIQVQYEVDGENVNIKKITDIITGSETELI